MNIFLTDVSIFHLKNTHNAHIFIAWYTIYIFEFSMLYWIFTRYLLRDFVCTKHFQEILYKTKSGWVMFNSISRFLFLSNNLDFLLKRWKIQTRKFKKKIKFWRFYSMCLIMTNSNQLCEFNTFIIEKLLSELTANVTSVVSMDNAINIFGKFLSTV